MTRAGVADREIDGGHQARGAGSACGRLRQTNRAGKPQTGGDGWLGMKRYGVAGRLCCCLVLGKSRRHDSLLFPRARLLCSPLLLGSLRIPRRHARLLAFSFAGCRAYLPAFIITGENGGFASAATIGILMSRSCVLAKMHSGSKILCVVAGSVAAVVGQDLRPTCQAL